MIINIPISDDLAEQRLDSVVCSRVENMSRNRAAVLINDGRIRVNDQQKKPGYRMKPGDLVTGEFPEDPPEPQIHAETITLDILYEDDSLLVINKQPGMVVHPGSGNLTGTLVNALIAHNPGIRQVGDDPLRKGIVHRLDKDTSGLMVVAKTNHALAFLQKEFKQRRVQKQYLALVDGAMDDDAGRIDLPIGRHPVKRKQMAVNHETGKPAVSVWTVVQRFPSATLVEVLLKTGRTHQIRVHFYALGHPLVGDRVYQFRRARKTKQTVSRQMLHSHRLSFRHPYSGKRVAFEAPLPHDFSSVIERFEQNHT